jgi:feruloyl esterase
VATLARAELDACDSLDGIADAIIGNVAACRFDPSLLRCSAGDSDHCLSDEQIATVNSIHDELTLDFALAHEIRSYPGWRGGPMGRVPDAAGSAVVVSTTVAASHRTG